MGAQWDVFIAYPSQERTTADALHERLQSAGARVFLDHVCLVVGDLWDAEIAAAQQAARLTAVLVSQRSAPAFYQREEIARAIDLSRAEKREHRVAPIILDDDVDIPYGLRILHSVGATREAGGLDGVVRALLAALGLAGEPDDAVGLRRSRAAPARRSPFRPGTPLYVSDLLPGDSRRALVETIATDLTNARNVNLIGERRSGRTSTLNHVWARLVSDPANVIARVNLQDNVLDAAGFYGAVLRGLARSASGAQLLGRDRVAQLRHQSTARYEDLHRVLEELRDYATVIVLIDEFERCFELEEGFAPTVFYGNVRSLLGGDQDGPLAFAAVATREALPVYFDRGQITSTLPSYLPPRQLEALTDADVEETLAQGSPHTLSPRQRDDAAALAHHHPCLAQCAGDAWYRALEGGHDRAWVHREFTQLTAAVCAGARQPAERDAP